MILERLMVYALKTGVKVRVDNTTDQMMRVMKEREVMTGVLMCPCSFIPKTKGRYALHDILTSNRCPCSSMLRDVEEQGSCHCGIFVKDEGVAE